MQQHDTSTNGRAVNGRIAQRRCCLALRRWHRAGTDGCARSSITLLKLQGIPPGIAPGNVFVGPRVTTLQQSGLQPQVGASLRAAPPALLP